MKVSSKDQVFSIILTHQPDLAELGAEKMALFGSFNKDTASDESDVDLLVEFKKGSKSYKNFFSLASKLEDLMGRRVELVTKESLSPYIKPHILSDLEYVF